MSVDFMSGNFGTGRYNYGYIPDAPELTCEGEFREDYCYGCTEYADCKRESEEYERTDD